MPTTDRRRVPRTKLDQVAYIHIEPDNGAIVLNASGEGLAFHSMAPVVSGAPLRFAVQEQNRRLDISGELVWTDELQKIGGVRFTTLTTEARNQILDWIRKSEVVPPSERSTLGAALLKALPTNGSTASVLSFKPSLSWWKRGRQLKVSGFTRGLASGLLLSLLAFCAVLFCYAHRRQFGDSLVRLGQRLGASKDAAAPVTATPNAAAPINSPTSLKAAAVPEESKPAALTTPLKHEAPTKDAIPAVTEKRVPSTPIPVRMPSGGQHDRSPQIAKAAVQQASLREANVSLAKSAVPEPSRPKPVAELPTPKAPPTSVKDSQPAPPKAEPVLAAMRSTPASPVALALSPPSSRSDVKMYFDLGRFKKNWMAEDFSNKVAQLGIRTSVVPRGHLWTTGYQVLAGPYDNEAAEAQIKNELLSRGYKPRPYERGSRDFSFASRVTVERSPMPTGDFSIEWESYLADTKVKFVQGQYSVATVGGRWIGQDRKFANNEYVCYIQPNGSRVLLEIHFAGMDRALVLNNRP